MNGDPYGDEMCDEETSEGEGEEGRGDGGGKSKKLLRRWRGRGEKGEDGGGSSRHLGAHKPAHLMTSFPLI